MPLNGDEPRETNDVAAEVIAEIEAGGGSDETIREITEPEKPAAKAEGSDIEPVKKDEKKPEEKKPEAKSEEKKDEDDDDFDKVPAEIDDPKAKGKKVENRLPHSRVKKMVEKAVKRAREAADTEWKAKHEPLEGTLNSVLSEIRRLDELMATDTDAFLAEIAKAHPAYKEYVRQVKAAEKAAAEDPEPQPDVPNEKGEMVGYSIGQAKKLMQWTARQEVKGVRDEIKPVKETIEGAQRTAAEQARRAQQDEADLQRAQTELQDAEANWPGFKEHKAEIETVFMANKNMRLHDAYRHVYVAKLQKAAADARAQVLAEMAQEPVTSTNVAGGATERVVEPTKAQSTEDIARQVIRELEGATR